MNKPAAPKTAPAPKRYRPTHAYFDFKGPFQIISPRGAVLHTEAVPEDVHASEREAQEAWVTDAAKAAGFRVRGRSKDYPWGFYLNV